MKIISPASILSLLLVAFVPLTAPGAEFRGIICGETTMQQLVQHPLWGPALWQQELQEGSKVLEYRPGTWSKVSVLVKNDVVRTIDAVPPGRVSAHWLAEVMQLGEIETLPQSDIPAAALVKPGVKEEWDALLCKASPRVLLFTQAAGASGTVELVRMVDENLFPVRETARPSLPATEDLSLGTESSDLNTEDEEPAEIKLSPPAETIASEEEKQAEPATTVIPAPEKSEPATSASSSTLVASQIEELEIKVKMLESGLDSLQSQIKDLKNIRETDFRPESSRQQGTLVVINWTGLPQTMAVNGQNYLFQPGSTDLPLPLGEVTTQLASQASPTRWSESDWITAAGGKQLRVNINYRGQSVPRTDR